MMSPGIHESALATDTREAGSCDPPGMVWRPERSPPGRVTAGWRAQGAPAVPRSGGVRHGRVPARVPWRSDQTVHDPGQARRDDARVRVKRPAILMAGLLFFGSPTWARTRDLRINSPSLYRLSYRGTAEKRIIASFSLHRQQRFDILFLSYRVFDRLACRRLCNGCKARWRGAHYRRRRCGMQGLCWRLSAKTLGPRYRTKNPPEGGFPGRQDTAINRTPAFPRQGSCAASARSSCTACGSSSRERYTARRRTPPARPRGSPTESASSCPDRY